MKPYALEAKCLRVLQSAETPEQVLMAMKYVRLAVNQLGVLSRETEEAWNAAVERGMWHERPF